MWEQTLPQQKHYRTHVSTVRKISKFDNISNNKYTTSRSCDDFYPFPHRWISYSFIWIWSRLCNVEDLKSGICAQSSTQVHLKGTHQGSPLPVFRSHWTRFCQLSGYFHFAKR